MKICMSIFCAICIFLSTLVVPSYAKENKSFFSTLIPENSGIFSYPVSPSLKLVDLYGKQMDIQDYRNKVVVLAFIDKKSQAETIKWVENLPSDYLGDKRLVFINVIFPGGISFVIPRAKVVKRLRKDIGNIRASLQTSLNTDEGERLEKTEIRWAADWKRQHSSRWGAIRHRVNLFLIDSTGHIRDTMRGMSISTTTRLKITLPRLLAECASSKPTESARVGL